MSARILGWRVSSFLACPGVGGLGTVVGAGHPVGGGTWGASVRGAPYVTSRATWDNHSHMNVARLMSRGLQMASMMPLKKDVKKQYCAPSAKSNATGFRPKNKRPSSIIAQVVCVHTSFV
jgi:hypothetical protein